MSIYDVFSGGSRPFNKEEWAAQKQAQRQEAYELSGTVNVSEPMGSDILYDVTTSLGQIHVKAENLWNS